ncbi:MAG TPA: GNAT family N-acetyltransferase [Jatrophihabitantaceae bacterium]|nr:GNAT family N-acetyltransferase [Jatrophihabitantaceae bacterium]
MSDPAPARPVYVEPARSYTGVWFAVVGLVAACLLDTSMTHSFVHLIGWIVAAVLIVGIYALAVRTARALRTVTVTDTDVTVGAATIDRANIEAVERDVDITRPVLGQAPGGGLPRGAAGLTLVLADGSRTTVPTRFPGALAEVLAVPTEVPDVRPAEAADLPLLLEVERRSTALYRVSGTPLPEAWSGIAEIDEPSAVFVVGRPPFGFIRLVELDGLANIAVIAIVPGRVRAGVGTELVEAAAEWARAEGYRAMCVSTYADIAWNAPFFAACGFAETADIGAGMTELRDWERAIGLDGVGRRIVMRREL